MKEVSLGRYAGPYQSPPYNDFIQSPIGLVPKGQNDTRLIFHLSYPQNGKSTNSETLEELCTVKYCGFSDAIKQCLTAGEHCVIAKSDMSCAFRQLGLKPSQYCLVLLKARSPLVGKVYFFAEKALSFGASIMCSHFQRTSNALAHLVKYRSGRKPVNFLDDFFFCALYTAWCNNQVQIFIDLCGELGFPISEEKTCWASHLLAFLGLLIDTIHQFVAIPVDKIQRAKSLIEQMLVRKNKKATVREVQKLTGYLNFLCRAVVPGRTFLRRMYYYIPSNLKPFHHIRVNREI